MVILVRFVRVPNHLINNGLSQLESWALHQLRTIRCMQHPAKFVGPNASCGKSNNLCSFGRSQTVERIRIKINVLAVHSLNPQREQHTGALLAVHRIRIRINVLAVHSLNPQREQHTGTLLAVHRIRSKNNVLAVHSLNPQREQHTGTLLAIHRIRSKNNVLAVH
ncbi:hypothetical protein PoB_006389000 [Plakobranchus ocellatus]|uniref:Uncharacterized protein n=1 Tax=Plakobranchus ocellatus TaxID=259542 RepID=A0AAV4CZZ9_9GAST|nr:hypothetical protein PoB_006389000 [Plakobranchus ocellatus]